ncbi:rrm-containing protein [Entamoeba marina]
MSERRYGGLGRVEEHKPKKQSEKPTSIYREVSGKKWIDSTMSDWPDTDYRIFVGNLGKEVSDETLRNVFSKYPSFQKAKVIKNVHTGKPKEYGFVSFSDPSDFARALREMNGKYIGTRPCKLSKGKWTERSDKEKIKRINSKYPVPPK